MPADAPYRAARHMPAATAMRRRRHGRHGNTHGTQLRHGTHVTTRTPPSAPTAQRTGASCAIAARMKPSSVSSTHASFISAGSFAIASRNFACVAGSSPA